MLPDARLHAREDLDVTDARAALSALDGADAVLHLAAFTNVDACEEEPERAFEVNARGTAIVAAAAAATGARVVYVSTDYVFDGRKDGAYEEDDAVNPLNVYGRSKLEGERAVLATDGNLVVRTSWVFGEGRNFVATMLFAARAGKKLRVVADQVGRPTWARPLARALVHLVEAETGGIVHVAGDGAPCSWADLADTALDAAGEGIRVERVDTSAYARLAGRSLAPRPANSTLSIEAARSLGVPLRDWRESVRAYVGESS
jgi:dTDP-4-dehydrorhamnose reductase